jgi:hypothetical protein
MVTFMDKNFRFVPMLLMMILSENREGLSVYEPSNSNKIILGKLLLKIIA